MNVVDAMVSDEGGKTYLTFGTTKIELNETIGRNPEVLSYVGKEVVMGIRPGDIHDEDDQIIKFPGSMVEAQVEVVEKMGSETYLYLLCEGKPFTARVEPRSTAAADDKIKVAFDVNRIHLFDKETEQSILHK
jgi:multiple sugar transport system ATP-binding protein